MNRKPQKKFTNQRKDMLVITINAQRPLPDKIACNYTSALNISIQIYMSAPLKTVERYLRKKVISMCIIALIQEIDPITAATAENHSHHWATAKTTREGTNKLGKYYPLNPYMNLKYESYKSQEKKSSFGVGVESEVDHLHITNLLKAMLLLVKVHTF